mmetsp:Transcript_7207/g.13436  ORF Transcript_7207/g.13436 Transcript_7207/m.13436 type:complete len:97 (+) Transcript_7207:2-292(+)
MTTKRRGEAAAQIQRDIHSSSSSSSKRKVQHRRGTSPDATKLRGAFEDVDLEPGVAKDPPSGQAGSASSDDAHLPNGSSALLLGPTRIIHRWSKGC